MFISSYKLKFYIQKILSIVFLFWDYGLYHPVRIAQIRAAKRTALYVEKNMQDAIGFYTQKELLSYASKIVKSEGSILEFGVYRGGSIRYIANLFPNRAIYGFDSFEGLPSSWSGYPLQGGQFDLKRRPPKVPRQVSLFPGWFDSTIPAWLHQNSENVSFLHIDCDLYDSTKIIFNLLKSRISSGTIILFDEYFGYSGWEKHEFKAFQEFVESQGCSYKYLAYSRYQVLIVIN